MRVMMPDRLPPVPHGGNRLVWPCCAIRSVALRCVGGALRDDLPGPPIREVKVATICAPQEVVRRIEAASQGGLQ